MKTHPRKKRSVLLLVALCCGVALAATVAINGGAAPYNSLSNVRGTSIGSMFSIRTAGLTQAAATYRLAHGPSSLPADSTFRMTWPDGSSESAYVGSPYSSAGSAPIPGTQTPAGSSGGCRNPYTCEDK